MLSTEIKPGLRKWNLATETGRLNFAYGSTKLYWDIHHAKHQVDNP